MNKKSSGNQCYPDFLFWFILPPFVGSTFVDCALYSFSLSRAEESKEQQMEVNNEIMDSGEFTDVKPKSLTGKTPYHYDGTKPLPDQLQEEYIHRIIFNMGDRKKAYEEVYHPNKEAPNYSGRAPYRFFERKGFVKRYTYLMNQAMYSAGLDKKTLLLKTAAMLEKALEGNKVRDFTTLVDTVLKLQVDENKYKITANQNVIEQKTDLTPVKELMESLNE